MPDSADIGKLHQSILAAMSKLDSYRPDAETLSVLRSCDDDLWSLIDYLDEQARLRAATDSAEREGD